MSSRKRHVKRRSKNLCDLEALMKGVQEALVHDLSDSDLRRISNKYERGTVVPTQLGWPPYVFKKLQQIRNFDKRIIWSDDKSFSELSNESLIGFRDSQVGFSCPEPMSQRALLVIQEAGRICHDILGEFSYDEWFDSCSYGKRAAAGLPRRDAYLDERILRSSGTALQHVAFRECLARDIHLLRAVRGEKRYRKTDFHIKASAVPKSFKSARLVFPDTILGGFLSRGLGDMIRRRLEEGTHIDLALQQERHRRWARKASITGLSSTIDMSKASDSFVWRHIELLVPVSWHEALKCVRTSSALVGDELVKLNSYMLMGSGHTFPLQTLLFYCLAEATRSLLKRRGVVSVYGDDIILPTSMSTQFVSVMTELGFTINSEKSFYDAPDPDRPLQAFFRESCGGDYKGGIDVRPYMPECDLQVDGKVSSQYYLAWCHKIINGLLDRWDSCEIPIALGFLFRQIASKKRKLCFVPSWEVSHAGIMHYIPQYLLHGYDCSFVSYERSHPTYWRLTFRRKKRQRKLRERPYVWYSYYTKRNAQARLGLPVLYELLRFEEERKKRIASHEIEVSLNGEPNRSKKGDYRWQKFGPKVIK